VQINPEAKPKQGIFQCVSLEFALGILHKRLDKVIVFGSNLIELSNKLSQIRPKAILPLDKLESVTPESLRVIFQSEFNYDEDLVVATARTRIISEMNQVPMPKDYVKFTNKLLCVVQGLICKKNLPLDAERVTMRVLTSLIDTSIIVNPVLGQLLHEGRICDSKTLAELQGVTIDIDAARRYNN
jgi:hypothetical protein